MDDTRGSAERAGASLARTPSAEAGVVALGSGSSGVFAGGVNLGTALGIAATGAFLFFHGDSSYWLPTHSILTVAERKCAHYYVTLCVLTCTLAASLR